MLSLGDWDLGFIVRVSGLELLILVTSRFWDGGLFLVVDLWGRICCHDL